MLSFPIRSLDAGAVTVDASLAFDDPVWEDADVRPREGVRVTGRLSSAGADRFYFSGHLAGAVAVDCRRCLDPLTVAAAEDVAFLIAAPGDETLDDDPDVFVLPIHSDEVDLAPAIREFWLLTVPSFVDCSSEGQVPCGKAIAASAASAPPPPATDPRWAALRDLKLDAD
jgi:uncharacterized metal-binding protein YceD (DUF177 family)